MCMCNWLPIWIKYFQCMMHFGWAHTHTHTQSYSLECRRGDGNMVYKWTASIHEDALYPCLIVCLELEYAFLLQPFRRLESERDHRTHPTVHFRSWFIFFSCICISNACAHCASNGECALFCHAHAAWAIAFMLHGSPRVLHFSCIAPNLFSFINLI